MAEVAFKPGDLITWQTGDEMTDSVKARYSQQPPYEVFEFTPARLEDGDEVMHRYGMGMGDKTRMPISAKVWIEIDGERHQFGAGHFVLWSDGQ